MPAENAIDNKSIVHITNNDVQNVRWIGQLVLMYEYYKT